MKQLYDLVPYENISTSIAHIAMFKNIKNFQYYKLCLKHLKRLQFKWISYFSFHRRLYYILPLDYLENASSPDRIFWCIIHSREIQSNREKFEFFDSTSPAHFQFSR